MTTRGFFKLAGAATGLALVSQVARPAERALAQTIGDPNATVTGNLYVPSGVVGIGTSSPVAGASLDISGSGAAVKAFIGPTDNHDAVLAIRSGSAGAYWQLTKRTSGASPPSGFVLQFYDGTSFKTPALSVTTTGQIGIGTTSPTAKLQVMDDGNAALSLYESGSYGAILRGWSSGGTNGAPTQTQPGDVLISLRGGGYTSTALYTTEPISQVNAVASEAFTGTAQGTYLTFVTTPNGATVPLERVRICNTGNVGIGVTDPYAPLDVSTMLRVRGSASPQAAVQGAYLNWNWANGSGHGETDLINNYGAGVGGFAFVNTPDGSTLTTFMYIDGSGNVGIGTTVPSARLSVTPFGGSQLGFGAASTILRTNAGFLGATGPPTASELALASFGFVSANHSSLGIRAVRTQGGSDWYTTAIGLGMDVDNTIRAGAAIWLHANQNVGIGTSSPQAALHLNGGSFQIATTKIADAAGCYYA